MQTDDNGAYLSKIFRLRALKKALANKIRVSYQVTSMNQALHLRNQNECMMVQTPPGPRRLSIENCSTLKNEKGMHPEEKKGSKTHSIWTRA